MNNKDYYRIKVHVKYKVVNYVFNHYNQVKYQ